nr:monocarboxylate transporter 13-like [Lytechinus pictus]
MSGGFLTGAGVMMTAWANGVAMVGVGVVCLTGIGSALVYIATLIFIRHNFPDFRSYALANGITVSGSSLAVSVFAPITRVLSDTYNWRGALLISSAIILNTMVFGALLRDRKVIPKGKPERLNDSASAIALIDNQTTSSRVTLNDGSTPVKHSISNGHGSGHHLENGNEQYAESTLMTSFDGSEAHEMTESFEHHEHIQPEVVQRTKEPILADVPSTILHGLLLFVIFLSTSSYSAVFVYLAAAGTERGLTPIESAGLLSATGISQAVVRFGHGFLVTVGCIKPLPLYIIVQFIMTIGILVLGVFQQYSVGCFAAILFGIGTGSVRSLNVVVQKEVDKRAGSTALGIVGLVSEVAAAVGGLFAGLLRDRSGEYLASFMVACGMTFASTLLSVVIMLLKRFIPCQPKNHVLHVDLMKEEDGGPNLEDVSMNHILLHGDQIIGTSVNHVRGYLTEAFNIGHERS